MNSIIINISKPVGSGRARHFFSVEMKGHHSDSVDFRQVYKTLLTGYPDPFYQIDVELVEETKTVVDMRIK